MFNKAADMRRIDGFSLIEMVLVTIVISVGMVGLVNLFGVNVKAIGVSQDAQNVAQYAQECTERVLAVRRDFGFDSTDINSAMCNSPALPSGFNRVVCVGTDITGATCPGSTYIGTSASACPSGVSCRNVKVTVTKGTLSSVITVMLVNY